MHWLLAHALVFAPRAPYCVGSFLVCLRTASCLRRVCTVRLHHPVAQRYADREELGSDDSEDTAVMTPTRNLQAMPTVAEDLSQELPPESYEDLRKAEGMLGGLWIAYRKAQLHPSL